MRMLTTATVLVVFLALTSACQYQVKNPDGSTETISKQEYEEMKTNPNNNRRYTVPDDMPKKK